MIESLSENLVEVCARPVDEAARRRAARHLLDWLGCALLGTTAPVGEAMARFSAKAAGGRCFAAGAARLGPEDAAFCNGALGNVFEMDDVHRTSILHAGDVVIPAALAAAQHRDASGDALLDAIVRGYEAALRLGTAAAHSGYSAWYNSGTCGVFGAAMAASGLLRLDRAQTADALGQAGMMASGIWQCRLEPGFGKQLAAAHAARSGLTAAMLAEIGFPGPRRVLEGELGFFRTYYPSAAPAETVSGPRDPWKLHDVSFKPWPACRHAHPAIEAALALRRVCRAKGIERVTVSSYAAAIEFCDNPAPETDHDARFSLQYCVASALTRGEPLPEHFSADARGEPAVLSTMQRISVRADEEMTSKFPRDYTARIELLCDDGSQHRHSVATAKGDPENPMNETELDAKFTRLARLAGIGDDAAATVRQVILELPDGQSLAALNAALIRVAADLPAQTQEGRTEACH